MHFLAVLPALFFLAFSVQAAPDSGKKEELNDLRSRIKALQDELEQTNEDKSEVTDALKHSERRISDVNRGLRELELHQRKLLRTLKQLAVDTRTTEAEIADQQQRLAELLRKHYHQGGGDALKLMLNGENPGEVARNIEYYGYIGRARADLIRQHRASLQNLQTLQEQTRKTQTTAEAHRKTGPASHQSCRCQCCRIKFFPLEGQTCAACGGRNHSQIRSKPRRRWTCLERAVHSSSARQ